MKNRNYIFSPVGIIAALLALAPCVAHAAPITKVAAGTDLMDGASWGGTAPGSGDVATWTSTSLGAGLTLGEPRSWKGISVTSALSAIDVKGGGALTVGSDGINMATSTVNLTLQNPITLGANQTWNVNSGRNLSVSGMISGVAMVTKEGAGNLVLSHAANTFNGGMTLNAGVVLLGSSAPSVLGKGPVIVNSPAILQLNGNGGLTNAFTFNGVTVVNGNSFPAIITGPVTLTGISTIDLATTGNMQINGNVTGSGGLIKKGTGNHGAPLTLSGANSFTGPVTIEAGSIAVGSFNRVNGGTETSNLGAPTTEVNGTISLGNGTNSGTLRYTGPGETTDRMIKFTGATGSAILIHQGTGKGIPTTRGESGLLKFTSNFSVPGSGNGDNRKTLILNHTASHKTGTQLGLGEISGSIGDSLSGAEGQRATSITKAGPGTWTLSGANTYSGTTKVEAGTLALTRADALGAGPLDITDGSQVRLDYIGTREISALTYNAGTPLPNGTYGSSQSIATNKDDTRFGGLGTLTIGAITSPTTTTLVRTSGTGSSKGGAKLTFTATVAGKAPTGKVMFYDGVTLIGSSSLNGSAQAFLITSALGAGSHAITALYIGDPGNASSSSAALIQDVVETRAATTTTLTTRSNTSNHGAMTTFVAKVSGGATGSVIFYNGTAVIGTASLSGFGEGTLAINNLPVGWNPITARYQGDATHAPSVTTAPLFQSVNPPAGNGKVKVFVLVGQSNMVGKGKVEHGRDPNHLTNGEFIGGLGSLRNMVNRDPEKYGYLADPANPINGNPGWMTRSDVWVTYTGQATRKGDLDVGFGNHGGLGTIGPEYGFGVVLGSQLADQVLLIKIAWGGKSLIGDFRPPSSGGTVGPFYTQVVERVHYVLDNLAAEFPAYKGGGYELAGFGWHQGWNDIGQATEVYETNLVNLIKDIRAEFKAPKLPVVIAGTGMGNNSGGTVLQAQLNVGNPALHPEFAGTVISVDTRPFDYGEMLSGATDFCHWNWNGESYFKVGESMGKAMVKLLKP